MTDTDFLGNLLEGIQFDGSLDSTQLAILLTADLRVNFFEEQVRATLDRYSLLLVESALLKRPSMTMLKLI